MTTSASSDAVASSERHLFAGRSVAIVHPAWAACGSAAVFVAQAEAYRGLGAIVYSIAVDDYPAVFASSRRDAYLAATSDMPPIARDWLSAPKRSILSPSLVRAAAARAMGNVAELRLEVARHVAIPSALAARHLDLIHCNHFFCLPVAEKLRAERDVRIVLETHDVQARQYASQKGPIFGSRDALRDRMLAREIETIRRADLLVHLNSDEFSFFQGLLPDRDHALLYPAVRPVPLAAGQTSILLVAAANEPNVQSIAWLLGEVLPLAGSVSLTIAGTVDKAVRNRHPSLFAKHRSMFTGYVENVDELYRQAAGIALPTVAGHGVSIKTIEAMASGAPIVATTHAFRGMQVDPSTLRTVRIADDAAAFAQALTQLPPIGEPRQSDTYATYQRLFSPERYRQSLAALVAPLMPR